MSMHSFSDLKFEAHREVHSLSQATVTLPRIASWALCAANFFSGYGWDAYAPIAIASDGIQATALFDSGYAFRAVTLFFPERFFDTPFATCQMRSPLERSMFHVSIYHKDLMPNDHLPMKWAVLNDSRMLRRTQDAMRRKGTASSVRPVPMENKSCLVKIVAPQELDRLLQGQNLPQADQPYTSAEVEKLMNVLNGHRPVAYARLALTAHQDDVRPTCYLG